MEKLTIDLARGSYNIYFGAQIWSELEKYRAKFTRTLVVTDSTVDSLYGDRLAGPKYLLPQGEHFKTPATAIRLVEALAEQGLDRQSLVIALGGGLVGDLAGFAASIYLRGLAYLQVPTTLLAQVDSSVGGKTGVNLAQGKNLMGSFYQPRAVFIDPQVLCTLPKRELSSGLAEVLKYGIIADPAFFQFVIERLEDLYSCDQRLLQKVIYRCCKLKGKIVAADEFEHGLRKVLNYGHTFGHALETATSFQTYSHGEAVLLGMFYESRLAKELGLLENSEHQELEFALVKALQLADLSEQLPKLELEQFSEAFLHDKKNHGGSISFLLPTKLGRVEEVLLSLEELTPFLKEVLKS